MTINIPFSKKKWTTSLCFDLIDVNCSMHVCILQIKTSHTLEWINDWNDEKKLGASEIFLAMIVHKSILIRFIKFQNEKYILKSFEAFDFVSGDRHRKWSHRAISIAFSDLFGYLSHHLFLHFPCYSIFYKLWPTSRLCCFNIYFITCSVSKIFLYCWLCVCVRAQTSVFAYAHTIWTTHNKQRNIQTINSNTPTPSDFFSYTRAKTHAIQTIFGCVNLHTYTHAFFYL